ncbi:MAG: serine/threonine protein kinase [Thermoguttaceae bacterium]
MSDTGPTTDSTRPSTADLSGRQVGDFHFLRRLGRGAMAEVYLAEQCPLKRWVAVKILRPDLADDRTYLRRFEREAQAAASLVHANIVQIHEVGQVEGLHYIVQEYVQGQNLRDWLARNGPPLLQQALSIMRQITAALGKAAEQGVIHRDIKPENIMITSAGEVKVADFGLARVLRESETDATSLTQIGITMGTPLYMSPEQVEGRPLDHRSDLYSFGVLCYHMLTGKPPFVGDTALAVAVQHVKAQAKPLEEQRPDLPPALCRVVHQMLAKSPEQRWSSCGELLRELYRIQVEQCPQASPEELASWSIVGMEPLTDPRLRAKRQLAEAMRDLPRRGNRLGRWLLAAGMAAAFVVAGGAAWLTMRPQLLTPPQHGEKPSFPRQDTEWRQWFQASRIGTEEAWKSVIDYPNVTELVALRAKQQLVRIYLVREQAYDQAIKVCDELASTGDNNSEFKAFGLAGKCVALSLQQKYGESAEVLNQFAPLRESLRDNQMKRLLRLTIDKNREHLGAPTDTQLEDWVKQVYGPNG